MSALRALYLAGFRHQASFRFALVSGILTNTFFGFVRSAVFIAVYRGRDEVATLSEADTLTYVWVMQAGFAMMWAPWVQELPARIRSGEWTAELTRPGSILGRHLAYDLGRTSAMLVFRAPVPLAVAAVVFDLHMPTDPGGIVLLVASLALAGSVGSCLRFLLGSIAFWSPDHRGIYALAIGPLLLFGGFVVPLEFFPDALRTIAIAGPLSALLRAPVAVATGASITSAMLLQVSWLAAFVAVCGAVLRRATTRMVVFGG